MAYTKISASMIGGDFTLAGSVVFAADGVDAAPTLDPFPAIYLYRDEQGIPRMQAPKTPPMGYNAWNTFRSNVSKNLITGMVDEIVRLGLDKVGFEYINLDDCWVGGRGADGKLYSLQTPGKFPDETDDQGNTVPGAKVVGDYVRSKGLKFGIYNSPLNTCAAYWDNFPIGNGVGSAGHEETDIASFASWGVSYLKYDRCNYTNADCGWNTSPDSSKIYSAFFAMRDAIGKSGSDMFYSTNFDFHGDGWSHLNGANVAMISHTSRVAADISDFETVIAQIDSADQLKGYATPGYWNDMDMMQVGNLPGANLDRVNMGMWAIMNSPMLIGSDIRNLDQINPEALAILKNEEVIAFNKDPLNTQAVVVRSENDTQVWAKPLFNKGERAIALFNRGEAARPVTVSWQDLKLQPGQAEVRDLWSRTDKGSFTDNYTVTVPAQDVVMLKITGKEIPIRGTRVLRAEDIIYSANSLNDIRTDISGDGHKLSIDGTQYEQGFGTNAPSQIQVRLDGACSRFTVRVGIDDQIVREEPASNGYGKQIFQIWGDGRLLAETGVLERRQFADLEVDLTGVTMLRLVARLGYNRDNAQWYGYANWLNPTIT